MSRYCPICEAGRSPTTFETAQACSVACAVRGDGPVHEALEHIVLKLKGQGIKVPKRALLEAMDGLVKDLGLK